MSHSKNKRREAPMNRERLSAALKRLAEYRRAKAPLEARIRQNEKEWMPYAEQGEAGTRSSWTFNSIAGKHADAMDNLPCPTVLAREVSDSACAEALSRIIPVILERNRFEKVWSDCWYDKLKTGSAVYGVFWDSSACNTLGDISIKRIDLMNLYWEEGVEDIEDSESVFYLSYISKERLLELWPRLKDRPDLQEPKGTALNINTGREGDDGKCAVVDWYYKKRVGERTVVHLCKSALGVILYSSENDPELAERGYYDHGRYPFIFDTMYRSRGTPCGVGAIEVMKNCQEQIDLLEAAIMENSRMAASRRYFARQASGINEEEFADWSSPIVHYSGSGDPRDSIMPIEVPSLDGVYLNMLRYKVDELKETSGNRDFSQGGTSFGVTAASAIEALQEAGSKLSRDLVKGSYRAFEEICLTVIELIRQFYTLPRCFRITSPNGYVFEEFDNSAIRAQSQGEFFDRLPIFDVSVKAMKQSPYAKASLNDMARAFFDGGFFSPAKRSEALICLEMMDFEGKDSIKRLIEGGKEPLPKA